MSLWICPRCGEDYAEECDLKFRHAASNCLERVLAQRDQAQRERDNARAELEETARENLMLKPALAGALRERDEARAGLAVCDACCKKRIRERDEALEKARWAEHIAECRGKEIISREEEIEQFERDLDKMERERDEAQKRYERQCAGQKSEIERRVRAERERDKARADVGVLAPQRDEARAALARCQGDLETTRRLLEDFRGLTEEG